MSDILQIFTGNPLTTFVGKKIEAATRPELESEDWALNMEICDIINENDDDAKDAARAIKKRLLQIEQDQNFTITYRTLTVLETCVSNCSHRFHVLVMTKDFIQDLVKLIGPKNNPPIDLQERVLSLIERWAETFRSQPNLNGVWSVYQDLKAKGVTFPQRDPSSHVPIQTPQRTVPSSASTIRQDLDIQNERPAHQPQQQPSGQVLLEGDGYNKISQDLTIVQSSIEMLNDILKVLDSPESESGDWNLAEELNNTCHQMKDRIVELIERVANEDLTIELLRLNDELNSVFTKYDQLMNNKTKSSNTSERARPSEQGKRSTSTYAGEDQQQQTTSQADDRTKFAGVSTRTLNELSLIDFNAMSSADKAVAVASQQEQFLNQNSAATVIKNPFQTPTDIPLTGNDRTIQSSLASDLGRMTIKSDQTNEVQQSSNSTDKKPTVMPEEISSVRESDFAEIENWLSTDSGRNVSLISGDTPSIEPVSVPNSEFDNFIASRALAGSTSTPDQQTQTKPQNPPA